VIEVKRVETDKLNSLSVIKTNNGTKLNVDEKELKSVLSYDIKSFAPGLAELTVTMIVNFPAPIYTEPQQEKGGDQSL
jgi:hypothetical protein